MYRSQNRKVPTVGVMVDWVASSYQTEFLDALRSAALGASVNLLCFVGGLLPKDPTTANARHRIYQLCGRHNVDGLLLLSSTLVHEVGQPGLIAHCQRYNDIPICSVGVELPGATSVVIDNESGMRDGVLHLIRDHGARRIAFIRGPLANSEAESRLTAYKSALASNGLNFDPRLVLNGDFMVGSGRQAVQDLVRIAGPLLDGIDAIVASNDGMAAGALAALEERGIPVPDKIKVLGFDDVEDARLTRPPLTTQKQPLEKQAREGLRALLDAIQFRGKAGIIKLPTELVTRRSCGCQGASAEVMPSRPPEPRLDVEAVLLMRRQRILDSFSRTARGNFGAAGGDWQNRLFNALVSDARGGSAPVFASTLQDIAEKVSARRVDLELCDELINVLRDKVIPSLGNDVGARDRLEHSFHQARIAIRRTAQRDLMREHLILAQRSRALSAVCGRLSYAFEPQELLHKIQTEIPTLDIECCVVALYRDDSGPRNARLLGGYDRRSGAQWNGSAEFDAKMLLPPEVLSADSGRSFFVLPLNWKEHMLGHALFEFNVGSGFACGAIAEALSVATWGARLTAAAGYSPNCSTELPKVGT